MVSPNMLAPWLAIVAHWASCLLQIFTFSIHIMFSFLLSDANDAQGLMRR